MEKQALVQEELLGVEQGQAKRLSFYSKYPNFFSTFIEPKLEYGLYGVKLFSKDKIDEIRYVTNELWKILSKVKNYIKQLDSDDLLRLGYPKELHEFISLDYLTHDTALSRFDFVVTDDGKIKMLEINNDTPFLVQEAFYMNGEMCAEFEVTDVNEGCHNYLSNSFKQAIIDCSNYLGNKTPNIVITGYDIDTDFEEFCTVDFIKSKIPSDLNVEFEEIYKLRVVSEDNEFYKRGLYTSKMKRVDILIKPAYPYEFLINDVAEDGEKLGIELLKMVKQKELALINPPSSSINQNKIVMAIIWDWYEKGIILTQHEKNIVQKYMLPTYLSNDIFVKTNTAYVKKPIYSREGSSVEIIKGKDIVKSQYNLYDDFQSIYQEYIQLPKQEVVVEGSKVTKSYIVGSFVVCDKPTALALRIGGDITEWNSHWLALGIAEEYIEPKYDINSLAYNLCEGCGCSWCECE